MFTAVLLLFVFAGAAGAQSVHSFNSGMNCYGVWKLPDTGQAACSDSVQDEISCPVAYDSQAQDGSYKPPSAQPAYVTDLLVTTDTVTGLIWISDPLDAGFNEPGDSTWEVAISSCENLSYAGHDDWRLPNVRELMSIVNYGATSAPYLYASYFPAAAGSYWTSTTYALEDISAWFVNFNDGSVYFSDKTSNNYVRCVRGGP